MRILPMGPRAVLVEQFQAEPAAWAEGFRLMAVPGVAEVVPGAETVLVACTDESTMRSVRSRLDDVRPAPPESFERIGVIEVPVRYDGDDLDAVATATGLSVEEVVVAHSGPSYVVAFCGFSPGFGYLRGLDERLRLPRRATPRTRVPAGSVAIAAEYSAVYPRSSPGGWHLLGRTDLTMFDPDRSPPAVFTPGARVRFLVA
jgi:KipI family sensor histidine kinase inhibitor